MGAPLPSRSEAVGHGRTSHPAASTNASAIIPICSSEKRPGFWWRPYRRANPPSSVVSMLSLAMNAPIMQSSNSVARRSKLSELEHPCNQRVVLEGSHLAMGSLRKIISVASRTASQGQCVRHRTRSRPASVRGGVSMHALHWRACRLGWSVQSRSVEVNHDHVARVLPDLLSDLSLDRQLVCPVTERHEGALERLAIDGSPHLHQPLRPEVLG